MYFCTRINPLRACSWCGACTEGRDERDEQVTSHTDQKRSSCMHICDKNRPKRILLLVSVSLTVKGIYL